MPQNVFNHQLLLLLPIDPMPERIKRLERNYPGIKVMWHNIKSSEGGRAEMTISTECWKRTTLLCTYTQLPTAEEAPNVRFVQLTSAGVEHCVGNSLYCDTNIPFCTSNGVHPPQIAEWVIGSWLSFQHRFSRYTKHMLEGYWEPPYKSEAEDSLGMRIGILGYGAIGRQCGRLASALGMEVYAYTSRERSTLESRKDDSYCVRGTGDPNGLIPTKWFHGSDKSAINEFLDQHLDLLVICLPLTESTRHLISEEQFQILSKQRTFVSNVGRGPHINTVDLIKALEKGQIRGAALDVTDPEPLPSDHPLWKAPNLLVTPHVSWQTKKYWDRVMEILEGNLARLSEGQPLMNLVNRMYNY